MDEQIKDSIECPHISEEESSIDFNALFSAIWKHKILYMIALPLSLILGKRL